MKFNFLFKLFTIVLLMLFSYSVYAETTTTNILSKIIIEKSENNTYKLHLFFNKKFTGNAFIQKGQLGSYFVYIPETIIQKNKIKIAYRNKKDKTNIKIDIEEKPFLKEDSQSHYVRLSVKLKDDYSIRILAKTIDKEKKILPFFSHNFNTYASIFLIAIIMYLIIKIYKLTRTNIKTSYTTFPTNYNNINSKLIEDNLLLDIPAKQSTLPKVNIKKALKTTDRDSFSCFNIPIVDETKSNQYEFKSTLRQTSNILKEKAAKSKHTSPINENYIDDSSELDLPVVEDIKKTNIQTDEKTSAPELLSELHITPTKGFYLTTINDSFALFGYVGEKVFLLQKFNDLTQINLQARFYDRNNNSDMYIVRLDSYKAMIEISDTGMKELAVL